MEDAVLVPFETGVEDGALGQSGVVQFEEKQQYKTYRFYDAGFFLVYHDVNFTCPVPWVCCVSIFECTQSPLTPD